MAKKRDLDRCPECGAEFQRGRLACPECGSDASTGWKDEEDIQYQSVEIPDTYEELVAGGSPRNWRVTVFYIAAVLALVGMLMFLLPR